MSGARGFVTAALTASLVLTPTVAFAQEQPQEPAAAAQAANEAQTVATTVKVALPKVGNKTIYMVGAVAPVSATVTAAANAAETPAGIAGTVEFFDGTASLGSTRVDAAGQSATATLETAAWAAGGARQITAVFTPDAGSALAPAASEPRVYRVVDTSRLVPDIELAGEPAAEIADGSLTWTIANIWFSNFEVGFEREVLGGQVTLPDAASPGAGASIPEKQAYYFRPFTFSGGSGARDAAGNRVISYEGSVRLTSGSANRWDFADPEVHIAANGDGYVTAVFSGFYELGGQVFPYDPVRVAIATFSGAQLSTADDGRVSAEITLNWAGQARGAGTWAHDYDESFPTEFVSLLHPAINLFFARSSVATDGSKVPHPITLSFTEQANEVPEQPLPFTDVQGTLHEVGINWMFQNGYVVAAEKFNPTNPTTRGAFATIMMRKNEPDFQVTAAMAKRLPFKDVKPSDLHYTGIVWMFEKGYATPADKFNATNPLTRGASASFLQRMEAPGFEPAKDVKLPFKDVKSSDLHYKGIVWMSEHGYAAPAEQYNAVNSTTRGAMSTFLYRIYG